MKDMSWLSEVIERKDFSVKDTGISYRIINNWSEKGLISHLRSNVGTWHKLSFFELIEIAIYEELRKCGFTISKLKTVKKTLTEDSRTVFSKELSTKLSTLDLNILKTMLGYNNFLVCDRDGLGTSFYGEMYLAEVITNSSPSQDEAYCTGSSLVIVSLRKILEENGITIESNTTQLGKLITTLLDEEGKQDIFIHHEGFDHIKKMVNTKYINRGDVNSLSKLANQPNQKTTFNSNAQGVQVIKVEKEIK